MRGVIVLAACLALLPNAADAACTVAANGLAFGRIDLIRGTTSAGRITVACDRPGLFQVALASAGDGGAGRLMRGTTGGTLRYNLFSQPSMLIPWGDGSRLGPAVFAQSDGAAPLDLTVYGRVPPQTAPPGEYADQITVTVIF
ncbi:MAG: spore coat protein U domain-containing protein [Geminicoccaceae bacterium]|nr:spore coat protein U domain-containing protein [Geminicoccaceae bacterium]